MKQNNLFILLMLCSVAAIAQADSLSPDIKPNCETQVDPNGNPFEQLLDDGAYYSISTPDRWVPLIETHKDSETQKLNYVKFAIPHRIDMDPEYSEQIDQAVKTRNELPFAAYRFVRNVDLGATFDVPFSKDWTLYNARLADAGKHGTFCVITNVILIAKKLKPRMYLV